MLLGRSAMNLKIKQSVPKFRVQLRLELQTMSNLCLPKLIVDVSCFRERPLKM